MKGKLLIDCIALLSPLTGIGRYTYEISRNIQKYNKYNLSFYYGYSSNNLKKQDRKKSIITILIGVPFIKKLIRKLIVFSSKYIQPSYDLYWQPNFIPNNSIKAKKIVTTVHDFSFILHKDFHPKERIEYFESYFFKNIIKSDIIITGSNYSKQEILDRIDISEEKIKVIYHGINHNIFRLYDNINLDIKLPKKFILTVGSLEPRKNLLGLLKAYDLLNYKLKNEYKLVLVGFKGWENKELMEQINKNKQNIEYLGFISDIELAQVYNKAKCFIFPSFYEGFGLPILEAMACGTPVISSSTSSMPEVGKDAVRYFNPKNIEDIKNNLELVLTNNTLQKDMINKGLKRAKEFSWEKSAQEHIRVFTELLDEA